MTTTKAQQALQIAQELAKQARSSVDLHNAFFGIGGKFGELFPTRAEREEFAKTPEYQEILRLRSQLPQPAAGGVLMAYPFVGYFLGETMTHEPIANSVHIRAIKLTSIIAIAAGFIIMALGLGFAASAQNIRIDLLPYWVCMLALSKVGLIGLLTSFVLKNQETRLTSMEQAQAEVSSH